MKHHKIFDYVIIYWLVSHRVIITVVTTINGPFSERLWTDHWILTNKIMNCSSLVWRDVKLRQRYFNSKKVICVQSRQSKWIIWKYPSDLFDDTFAAMALQWGNFIIKEPDSLPEKFTLLEHFDHWAHQFWILFFKISFFVIS